MWFFSCLAFILLSQVSVQCATPLGPWKPGRSTYYTGIDDGACGYENISLNTFPYRNIAAPDQAFYANSDACGNCYEIQCINSSYLANACYTPTVVIQVTDECPCPENQQYCCGDVDHFDLSPEAFGVIANTVAGVINTQYRQVTCDTQGPLQFRVDSGANQYWFAILPFNVGGVGGVESLELQQNGSIVWQNMTRQTYNYWVLTDNNGLQVPFSLKLTLTDGTQITAPKLVTAITPGMVYSYETPTSGTSTSRMSTSRTSASRSEKNIYATYIILMFCLYLILH